MPSVWLDKRSNKNGKNHILRWELTVNGQRVGGSESCGPSKRYAEDRVKEVREELYAGRSPKPKIQIITIPAFAVEYLGNSKNTKAKNTHANFDAPAVNHFAVWAGSKLLGMIDTKTLFDWRDALLAEKLGPNTVRMRLRALSAAFGYAKERGYLAENPFDRLQRKSTLFPPAKAVARYLTPEELKKLFPALSRQVAAALYLDLLTGLRHEELLALDWKNVHRAKTGPWTAEIFSHKTGKWRTIDIERKAAMAMGAPKPAGLVLGWTTRGVIGKDLRAVAARLGLGRVRVHDFRHTWATNFMYRTGNSFELLYRGGWASMASAAVYQHLRKRSEPVEYSPLPHYFRTKTKNAVAA